MPCAFSRAGSCNEGCGSGLHSPALPKADNVKPCAISGGRLLALVTKDASLHPQAMLKPEMLGFDFCQTSIMVLIKRSCTGGASEQICLLQSVTSSFQQRHTSRCNITQRAIGSTFCCAWLHVIHSPADSHKFEMSLKKASR